MLLHFTVYVCFADQADKSLEHGKVARSRNHGSIIDWPWGNIIIQTKGLCNKEQRFVYLPSTVHTWCSVWLWTLSRISLRIHRALANLAKTVVKEFLLLSELTSDLSNLITNTESPIMPQLWRKFWAVWLLDQPSTRYLPTTRKNTLVTLAELRAVSALRTSATTNLFDSGERLERRGIPPQETFLLYLWAFCMSVILLDEWTTYRYFTKSWRALIPTTPTCEIIGNACLSILQHHKQLSGDHFPVSFLGWK